MSYSHFFVIRHDLRHGNRPYHYRQHCTTLHYTTLQQPKHSNLEYSTQRREAEIGFGRSPEAHGRLSHGRLFRGIRGGDESLIQETARPRGRLSTGFLRGWFSLYPTTRHYPNFRTRPWRRIYPAALHLLPLPGNTVTSRPLPPPF